MFSLKNGEWSNTTPRFVLCIILTNIAVCFYSDTENFNYAFLYPNRNS